MTKAANIMTERPKWYNNFPHFLTALTKVQIIFD